MVAMSQPTICATSGFARRRIHRHDHRSQQRPRDEHRGDDDGCGDEQRDSERPAEQYVDDRGQQLMALTRCAPVPKRRRMNSGTLRALEP